jgi:hypothetical protein
MKRRTAFCFGSLRALSTGSTKHGNASNVGHPLLPSLLLSPSRLSSCNHLESLAMDKEEVPQSCRADSPTPGRADVPQTPSRRPRW